jgi:hypothetical protein
MRDKNEIAKRRKEFMSAMIGLVAVVLLWRAIWDMAEAVMTPMTSLIIGFVLLGVLGYINNDYLKKLL